MISRLCDEREARVQCKEDIVGLEWFKHVDWEHIRERPAVIPVQVKSIDDTSNFDDFPDVPVEIGKILDIIISISTRKGIIFSCSIQ